MVTIIFLIPVIVYAILILAALFFWSKESSFISEFEIDARLSVIIPVKNEANTISKTIDSIQKQSIFPEIDLIIIDDGSSDDTEITVLNSLRKNKGTFVKYNPNDRDLGKKNALKFAIKMSENDSILLTDGDCTLGVEQAKLFRQGLEKSSMVLGPVFMRNEHNTLLEQFQLLDSLSTMGITAIAHFNKWFYSGSAASMGFNKILFNKLAPYTDNLHINSGDDVFFIEKIIANGHEILFLKHKDYIVWTKPESSWKALWKQRLRWAGKTKFYKSNGLKNFWITAGLFLVYFCVSFVLLFFKWKLFVAIWAIKIMVDFVWIKSISNYYKIKIPITGFVANSFIYPFFTVAIALKTLIKTK